MADNSLPQRDLSEPVPAVEKVNDERRKLFVRAALAGLPVVLATVKGRTVFASPSTPSCPASAKISTC
jgi:hypothetical protein